jgi:outer membrane lipoprotein carrier protein
VVAAPSCYNLIVNRQIRLGFAAVALASAVFAVVSASEPAPQQTSDSAKLMARLLEDHYRQTRTLQAVFLERYSEGQRQVRVESGTAYFRRPGQMRWEYDSPEKKLFVADGKTVWFYVPADRTVTKAPVKASSDWRTPLALLTGKADLSRLCGRLEIVSQKETPSGHVVLRCLPKGEKEPTPSAGASSVQDSTELPGAGDFIEVLFEVDSSTGELAGVRIRQAGGIELEYRFGDWREGLPIPDEMFRFHPPVGVAIVDGAAMNNAKH